MEYHSTTTLNEIRAHRPCKDGWEKLLGHLGKTKADDEPLSLLTVLTSNGLDHALWCLRVPSLVRLSRHFRAWCASQVLHLYECEYPDDARIRDQIAMLSNDRATDEARRVAWAAAWTAAWGASSTARRAALAARDAAWAAAWTAAAEDAALAARAARAAQEAQLRKMIDGVI